MKTSKFSFKGVSFEASNLTAGLYLVATPIGNLGDITLRALEVLAAADIILCEDTRHSKKLLQHYNIDNQLMSYHDHSDDHKRQQIIEKIQSGNAVALISDAGMPVFADPGFKLVSVCQEKHLLVTICPGASAASSALTLSTLSPSPHYFHGFLPPKQSARRKILNELKALKASLIFYESPHRILETLKDIDVTLTNRKIVTARELTKRFEEIKIDSAENLIQHFSENPPKGEFVLLIEGAKEQDLSWDEVTTMMDQVMEEHSLKQAAALVSETTPFSKRELYQYGLSKKNGS